MEFLSYSKENHRMQPYDSRGGGKAKVRKTIRGLIFVTLSEVTESGGLTSQVGNFMVGYVSLWSSL